MKRMIQALVVTALVVVLAGCGAKYMKVTPPMESPPEGKALVNFVRPSFFGKAVSASIWDGEKLIATVYGKQAFQYECEPGKHLFISWTEYKSPLEADLLPNHVYYVLLRTRMGGWRARVHQVPLNPNHELWSKALAWQKALPNYSFDQAVLATMEAENKEKIREYLRKYESEIKGTKYVQYLRPEDGVPR
ncbi:MAG: hypothetical protein JRF59_10915 [Deltaproteobacteria bacterium]|nr:hypothetical protein [Deltaproteobacteria bacterium]MBW2008511.1 hypothetical protein [Deltaproteobacteria bacterium]MBW2103058.1 hypothetical protein [Deltaproteobacteria bacterium]MBW2348338.1 hypothetical protein [Deltaproteobacteria bacterium]